MLILVIFHYKLLLRNMLQICRMYSDTIKINVKHKSSNLNNRNNISNDKFNRFSMTIMSRCNNIR